MYAKSRISRRESRIVWFSAIAATVQRIAVNLRAVRNSDAEGAEANRTLRGRLAGQDNRLGWTRARARVYALSSFRLLLPAQWNATDSPISRVGAAGSVGRVRRIHGGLCVQDTKARSSQRRCSLKGTIDRSASRLFRMRGILRLCVSFSFSSR